MGFPKISPCLDTSENNLISELYTPCLQWANQFDRGVGYFTTGWLEYNVSGMSNFATRGGIMRLITSPIISNEDSDAIIIANESDGSAYKLLEKALLENVEILAVKDSTGKNVFEDSSQERTPAYLIFGV